MAKRKNSPRKIEIEENINEQLPADKKSKAEGFNKNYLFIALVLVLFIIGLFAYQNKSLFVVGSVDNKWIFTKELNQKLRERFGKQVLEEMVNERILLSEAAKKGISVTKEEIEQKVAEITKNLGTQTSLSEVLKQQGMTEADFKKQVEMRLIVEKMLGDKVKVTVTEITDYIENNKAQLESGVGSDSAVLKKYAEDYLKQQKIGTEFEKWFTEIKQKVKISNFL